MSDHVYSSFDVYPEKYREDVKRRVWEIITPFSQEERACILRAQLDHLRTGSDLYWWNREAIFFICSVEKGLFRYIISNTPKERKELDLIKHIIEVARVMKHPEAQMEEVMEE